MGPTLLIAAIIVAAIIVFWALTRRSESSESQGHQRPEPSTSHQPSNKAKTREESQPQYASMLESLLTLQLKAREKSAGQAVLSLLEPIIDGLGEIIPQLNEEFPGSEMTFTANQMATKYLPELIGPFLNLKPDARANQQGALIQTLSSVGQRFGEIVKAVQERDESKFEVEAGFLKQKFG